MRALMGWGLFVVALLSPALASPAETTNPRNVYVGVYLADISGFDLNEGRFQADLQVWVKWLGDDTVPGIVLANGEIDSQDELARESDGAWHSVRWRVQGTFRGTFPVQKFPFDRQRLEILVDLPAEQGRLVPDLAGSGMAKTFSITGWLYEPFFKAQEAPAAYYSDFGSISHEGEPLRTNRTSFIVSLRRPLLAYIVKFMVPLAIILGMATVVFFIPGTAIEVRGTIGVTALLSCVAFQFANADALPDVSYLVTADKMFLGAYLIILISLIESVVAYNWYEKKKELVTRIDRISYVVLPLLTIVGGIGLILDTDKDHVVEDPPAEHGLPAVATSARDELVVGVVALRGLNSYDIYSGLLQRGLLHEMRGRQYPHLAVEVPRLTNDLIRFRPDGGMTVRWRIRPGLMWSDGTLITADDMLYSAGIYENAERRAIRKIDDRTIEIDFAKRHRAFVEPFVMFPKAAVQEIIETEGVDGFHTWLQTHAPPGDGPYRVASFERNKQLVLERNPFFAGPTPAIAHIKFLVSAETVADDFHSDRSQLAMLVGPESAAELADWPAATVRKDPSDRLTFLMPDLSTPPYDDLRVRQAILYAINRERAGTEVEGEGVVAADSYRPPWAEDHNPDLPQYDYSPSKARSLLRQAGFRASRIKIIASERGEASPERKMLERVQRDLRAAGFRVQLEFFQGSSLEKWKTGDHGALLYFSREGDEPGRFWNLPYAGGRFEADAPTRLFDQDLVDTYARYQATLFDERRVILSQRLQQAWAENLPVIPLVHTSRTSIHHRDLVGWEPEAGGTRWWNVETWHFVRPGGGTAAGAVSTDGTDADTDADTSGEPVAATADDA